MRTLLSRKTSSFSRRSTQNINKLINTNRRQGCSFDEKATIPILLLGNQTNKHRSCYSSLMNRFPLSFFPLPVGEAPLLQLAPAVAGTFCSRRLGEMKTKRTTLLVLHNAMAIRMKLGVMVKLLRVAAPWKQPTAKDSDP